MMGLGYGGARFKKGSPEAKAFMARLRAMRRRKTEEEFVHLVMAVQDSEKVRLKQKLSWQG